MTCTNATCPIFIICQNKGKPCPSNAPRRTTIHNGYRAMAVQEYAMRASAIDFTGDHG